MEKQEEEEEEEMASPDPTIPSPTDSYDSTNPYPTTTTDSAQKGKTTHQSTTSSAPSQTQDAETRRPSIFVKPRFFRMTRMLTGLLANTYNPKRSPSSPGSSSQEDVHQV